MVTLRYLYHIFDGEEVKDKPEPYDEVTDTYHDKPHRRMWFVEN